MTNYLFTGGGTAGHVNPLLATADEILRTEQDAQVLVLGTKEGLESRLVPAAGLELLTITRLPFPRSVSLHALTFPWRFARAVQQVRHYIRDFHVDVVVGFGGYAAAPAYLAARLEGVILVVHEANAIPGFANKLGAKFTDFVGTTFPGTPLSGATVVGMPLHREIAALDRNARRNEAREVFGMDSRPVLLVTGGSTGAARINAAISESAADIVESGWQILHTVGELRDFVDPNIAGYHPIPYCNRMDLALALADVIVSRAGAATVSEIAGLGIPAILVPYPFGNGEQSRNAAELVGAGGAMLCVDAQFDREYVRRTLLPFLADLPAQKLMAEAAIGVGIRDGAARLATLIRAAVHSRNA